MFYCTNPACQGPASIRRHDRFCEECGYALLVPEWIELLKADRALTVLRAHLKGWIALPPDAVLTAWKEVVATAREHGEWLLGVQASDVEPAVRRLGLELASKLFDYRMF